MTIQEFILKFRQAFGETAPLPISVAYSTNPAAEVKSVPRCIIGAISKVRNGDSLTLCADNVLCGGAGLYAAFRPMPERVPVFVSEVEHSLPHQTCFPDSALGHSMTTTPLMR